MRYYTIWGKQYFTKSDETDLIQLNKLANNCRREEQNKWAAQIVRMRNKTKNVVKCVFLVHFDIFSTKENETDLTHKINVLIFLFIDTFSN